MIYAPTDLLNKALAVCERFGDSKKASETRQITAYLDPHIRIEVAANEGADFCYVIVNQRLKVWPLVIQVLRGYAYDYPRLPEIINHLSSERIAYYSPRKRTPPTPWEQRLTTLFNLSITKSVGVGFTWNMSKMVERPGWSQYTRGEG